MGHYPVLLQPANRVLHKHPIRCKAPVIGLLLRRQLLGFHAPFASTGAPPLKRNHDVQPRVVVLHPVVAQIHPQAHPIRQTGAAPVEQRVIMPASPGVRCPVKDQALRVHGYLGLDRVPLLLSTVMGPPLTLVPGPRYLLLRGVQEGLKVGE